MDAAQWLHSVSGQWGSVVVGRFAGWMTHGFHPPGRYIICSANRRHLDCLVCNVHCRLCCVFNNLYLWENEEWRILSQEVCPDSVNQNIISISILSWKCHKCFILCLSCMTLSRDGREADIDTFVAPGVQAGISSWKCLQQRHDDDDDSTSPLRWWSLRTFS